MKKIVIADIIDYLKEKAVDFQFYGNLYDEIIGFSSLNNYKKGTITWVKESISGQKSEATDIKLAVSFKNSKLLVQNLIEVDNSKGVFFGILERFFEKKNANVICKDSVIEAQSIGRNVSIGHGCFICRDVVLEDNVRIGNNVQIECPCRIGCNSVIASGVVIGTDGFGYFKDEQGIYCKVPHFGGVEIGRNVEIGANTCIDRGTIDDTRIGNNVKIDNLCHIAHNVQIGNNSLVIALSMLGGSSVIQEEGYVAPGCLIKNQIKVGKHAMVGMGTVVLKDVPENKVVVGTPGKVIRDRGVEEL